MRSLLRTRSTTHCTMSVLMFFTSSTLTTLLFQVRCLPLPRRKP
jgi:hypothetical protein